MINDVVFYGNRDTLLQMPKINVQDIKTENWTGNCYGINFYAYCTETMSDEDINLLTTKFDLIGGNLLHERHYSRYKKVIQRWYDHYMGIFKTLGITLQHNDNNELFTMSIQEACRNTLIYDSNNPHANQYFINAETASLDDIPNFYAIGDELLQNYKKRHKEGFTTVGGGLHEVNPINGSNIIYTTRSNSVIIGQSHPLQQFYKLDTIMQVVANLQLVRSTLLDPYPGFYEMIAKHLGIEIKYLEDYEQTTQ